MSRVSTLDCTLCFIAGRSSSQHSTSYCPYMDSQSQLTLKSVRKPITAVQNDTAQDAPTEQGALPASTSNVQGQPQRNHELVQSAALVADWTLGGLAIYKETTQLAVELEAIDPTNNQLLPKLEYLQAFLHTLDDDYQRYVSAHPLSGPPSLAAERVRRRIIKQTLKDNRKALHCLIKKARLAQKPSVSIDEMSRLRGIIRFDDEESSNTLGKSINGKPLKLRNANHRMATVLKTALKAPTRGFETTTLSQEDALVLDEEEGAAEQEGEGIECNHRILLASPRTTERVRLHTIGFKTGKRIKSPSIRGWKYHTTRSGAKVAVKKATRIGELDTIAEEAIPFATLVVEDEPAPEENVKSDAHKNARPGPRYSAPLSGGGSRGGVTRRSQVTNARQRKAERMEAARARAEEAMKSTAFVSESDKADEVAEATED